MSATCVPLLPDRFCPAYAKALCEAMERSR
jgi:hypothetical protein